MPSPIITDDEGDALCCDSILLLIGLAPAILYITFTDKAYLAGAVLNTVFRFAVLPHALLIGWLSVRIWRSTPPPPSPRA